ncbi:MAG: MFS transporter [Candidatus Heimdallarchaeota archaeon]
MNKGSDKGAVFLVTILSSFVTPFIESSVSIALPSIGYEFVLDIVILNWVATSYFLAAAIFLVPFGRLADIYGRKKYFTYGVSCYTGASLLAVLSGSALVLIGARFLQGIGAAMIFGTNIAILTSVFPPGERGKVLGIIITTVFLGQLSGPYLGGFLTQQFGWRSIFLFNVPLGLIMIIVIFWKLKGEWAEAKGEKFDLVGSVIYGLMLLGVMYGFSQLPEIRGVWFILMGIIGLYIFVKWEIKVECPVLEITLFRKNRVFAFSNLAALIYFSATYATTFLLSLYLQYIKELSPQNAGLVLVAQPMVQATFSPIAGWLSDRIEPQRIVACGMTLTVVGLSLFMWLNKKTPIELIITGLAILGLGAALFSPPNFNVVMGSVEKEVYGVASGTRGTMRLLGQMLSMGITILLFTLYLGRVQITPELYPLFLRSVRALFIIFAGLCFWGGIFASFTRSKVH